MILPSPFSGILPGRSRRGGLRSGGGRGLLPCPFCVPAVSVCIRQEGADGRAYPSIRLRGLARARVTIQSRRRAASALPFLPKTSAARRPIFISIVTWIFIVSEFDAFFAFYCLLLRIVPSGCEHGKVLIFGHYSEHTKRTPPSGSVRLSFFCAVSMTIRAIARPSISYSVRLHPLIRVTFAASPSVRDSSRTAARPEDSPCPGTLRTHNAGAGRRASDSSHVAAAP